MTADFTRVPVPPFATRRLFWNHVDNEWQWFDLVPVREPEPGMLRIRGRDLGIVHAAPVSISEVPT